MTEKLYEDAYLQAFDGTVLACEAKGKAWRVALNRTCFFPEGGGQAWDTGTLGDAQVLEVHEKDGVIWHTCNRPLAVGDLVHGAIDWARRFDLMQQHSGEHILSGLIHERYGCDNVGFHLGADLVTIDFNVEIPDADLPGLELAANQVIWANRETVVTHPDRETLETIPYRSKKALTGDVRIVQFPGADVCACCGTHVSRAGEVGQVRILSSVRFREGVRLEILAGQRALAYTAKVLEQNHQVSMRLSAKALETAAAVARMAEENEKLKYRLTGLENSDFQRVAEDLAGRGNVLVFREDLDADGVRRLTIAVQETCGGCAAVFGGRDGEGYKYALGTLNPQQDLRELAKALNQNFSGRGGGKPGFVQGSLNAARSDIEGFFGG